MRIVGGAWRGRRLAEIGRGDQAARLRPTADRVRESVFNILAAAGDPVTGARVLDLFAGTGALGLEALSRGAARAMFVDDGRVAERLLRQNIAALGAGDRADILRRDATALGPAPHAFDLVFLDPPYGRGLGARAIGSATSGGWLATGATLVWEEGSPPAAPAGFTLLDSRRYGDTEIAILRAP
ncbi:MAG: 16S rRNA (guanine(966)-N(2))-methyltransferase RsmD [Pseudomonadota bacterium]